MAKTSFDSHLLYEYDEGQRMQHGVSLLCGVDEAGRGPLCGPVSIGAVVLNPQNPVEGINDSKKLSEKKREELYPQIVEKALAWQVVLVPPEEIDRINILQAVLVGMQRAVLALAPQPQLVLVDGNTAPALGGLPSLTVTKGDATSASIAAASILAKVTRDRFMEELDKEYPQYRLAQHKGYPTKLHYELLQQYGVQSFYRRSYLKKRGL
ncbi:MAG: ribonuclease HII [Oscillospiraceae bacterium]